MLSRKQLTGSLIGIVAATALLSGSVALANADQPSDPAPAPAPSCADAITAYQAAQNNANSSAKGREDAQTAYDKAKADLANYDATHGGKDQPPVVAADRQKLVDAVDTKSADLKKAQDRYNNDSAAANNSRAAADKACEGKQGEQGPQGPVGVNGKDGIDARVILSPNVCARAVVRPDTNRLVRVIVLIPCPVVTPPPPATAPNPGDVVTIINKPADEAKPPVTTETHLPVTH